MDPMFGGQARQAVLATAPTVVEYVFAEHGVQDVELKVVEKNPAEHSVHTPALLICPYKQVICQMSLRRAGFQVFFLITLFKWVLNEIKFVEFELASIIKSSKIKNHISFGVNISSKVIASYRG